MKKIYLLTICIGFAAIAFAQSKQEFGFVVKAGNNTFPGYKTTNNYSDFSTKFKAGSIYSMGIWHSLRLGSRWRLSTELLYLNTAQSSKTVEEYHPVVGSLSAQTTLNEEQVNYHSFAIPVKLHYATQKDGKFYVSFGGGISRIFSSVTQSSFRYEGSQPSPPTNYENRISGQGAFPIQLLITAGLSYRLNNQTYLGLEYTFLQGFEDYYRYSLTTTFCDCAFCECGFGVFSYPTPNTNSFSLSLKHNILH